jgi:ribosomal protein S18 acetylase RimI-like enzyme
LDLLIRNLGPGDRDAIAALLESTEVFRPEELEVALELVDTAMDRPEQKDYTFAVAEVDGAVAGYTCWGATPCTRGTFDLYWIATSPSLQGKGVGRSLMDAAEKDMKARGGRLCVIETSSQPQYDPTRRFYLGLNYTEAAVVRDFYTGGDHKVIYTKHLLGDD